MSFFMDDFKEDLMDGSWTPGTIIAVLFNNTTTGLDGSEASQTGSDLSGVASDGASLLTDTITTVTWTDGVFDGDDVSFPDIDGNDGSAGASTFDAIAILNGATLATATVMMVIDGFSDVSEGSTVNVNWNGSGISAIV